MLGLLSSDPPSGAARCHDGSRRTSIQIILKSNAGLRSVFDSPLRIFPDRVAPTTLPAKYLEGAP